MYKPVFYLVFHFSLFLVAPISSSSIISSLSKGSSLSTSQETVISSPNGDYAAGFHTVGANAYSFAIWFSNLVGDDKNFTIVWMANRDKPVNGRHSRLSLTKSGNLVLIDAGQCTVWQTETQSNASVELELLDNGNLVLTASHDKSIIWQSFDTPTDTLLPGQALTKTSKLVSLRSSTNYSSGFYKLQFADNNVLQLLYDGLEMSGVYWPPTWLTSREANRSTYNNSKIAVLDRLGQFNSTDNFNFKTADHGEVGNQRRLTLDIDGNIRVYSLNKQRTNWEVSWQLRWQPCVIHGLCGPNSLCTYSHDSGRKCTCLQHHKMKNVTDWSYGCEPEFKLSCPDSNMVDFVHLHHVEFFGYDVMDYRNVTLEQCKQNCLDNCDCKGIQFNFETKDGVYTCYLKTLLFNGYRSPSWKNSVYIKLPKEVRSSDEEGPIGKLQCERTHELLLNRTYKRKEQHGWLKSFIWFTVALGVFEIICLVSYLITTLKRSNAKSDQVYIPVVNRFKRFTYAELKKATSNFRYEIGQGSGGVVYKGKLSDNRIAAIEYLKLEANQGEAEFPAESPSRSQYNMDDDEMEHTMHITWVREKMHRLERSASQIQQVVDPALDGNYDLEKMEVLIKVALQCSEEDRDARPTMSQVADMLQA
ncbi:hypothetical protein K7X08_020857 [Anisodus acutangulus]|uniref:Receptor-like serine/threonine-protein kinase n=1 Tax=Anisodus acutangulus TaxID=402998 RepID=A0A9Q1MT95_9SOLA|nr:hypothetical protein K7X08_020857 [Anisodus acutangulus]